MAESKLFKTIIDNLPHNVYFKDLQSKKILANKSELYDVATTKDVDVPGKSDYNFYPYNITAISVEEDQHVLKTGKPILNKETLSLKKRRNGNMVPNFINPHSYLTFQISNSCIVKPAMPTISIRI